MNSDSAKKPRIAFLGLGIMGAGMARRLLAAGFPVTAYNRNPAKAQALAAEGANAAATPKEAMPGAGIALSMLSDDDAARAVWLGRDGALAAASRGCVLLECSTASVAWIEELAAAAARQGCEFLDAPVTGSKPEAAKGELRFLVGGSETILASVRPALDAMGKTVVLVGPTGSGARMKLINNFLAGVQIASFAEALAAIERSGLDRDRALDVLLTGAPGSPIVRALSPRMINRDYDPRFAARLMAKDLTYAAREGRAHGVPMSTAAGALEVFQRAIAAGWGEQDFSSIVEPMRQGGAAQK